MKRLILAALMLPLSALAQTYPSPTFNSLTLQNPLTAANGGTGSTTSTGSGSVVLSNSPTLVTPALGTPSSVTLTNGTSLPISTGVSGLGAGVSAGLANAATGSGSPVLATSPTLATPNLGIPSAVTLTNGTGLPISTGVSGLGTGVASALGSAVTGSGGPVLATSPIITTPSLAGASDTAGLSVKGPILLGSSTILTACDNTGATDATACLNGSITTAEGIAGGGVLIIQPGTYKITGTIFQNSASTILAYGATFKWGGSTPGTCCTALVKIGNSAATTYQQTLGITLKGLSLDANNTNNMYGFLWDTVRHGSFQDLMVQNITGSTLGPTGPFAYFATSTGTLSLNTSLCNFINLNAYNVYQGLALSGTATGGSATDNGFYGVHFFNIGAGVGIDMIQYADTNYFYQTELFSGASSGTFYGVVFNDGPSSSTQANDIQEEQFDGLTVVAGGTGSTNVGLQINQVQDINIRGYRFSSAGGTFTPYNVTGQANYVSYSIQNLVPPLITQYASPPPTAVSASGAGTSPPAPAVQSGSNNLAGTICFGTGTSPSGGTLMTVTFPQAFAFTPKVSLSPSNGATWGMEPVAVSVSSSGFSVFASGTVTASEPNSCSGYSIAYKVTP